MAQKMKSNSNYSTALAGVFFCAAFFFTGILTFLTQMSFDISSVIYAAKKILPSSCTLALLGYFIGKIIDNSGKTTVKKVQTKKMNY